MDYYVYVGKIGDEFVYVGKGTGKRYLHLNSGVSTSYSANESHFKGVKVSVDIVKRFEKSSDALSYETCLINLHKPKWNYQTKENKTKRKVVREHKGVQFMKNKTSKQWRAYTHIDGVKKHIGYFETEQEAKEARNSYNAKRAFSCLRFTSVLRLQLSLHL